jgi:flagellar biosynthesis/type III secretory pathway protein FliH
MRKSFSPTAHEASRDALTRVIAALQSTVDKLNNSLKQMIPIHREVVTRLALEIARNKMFEEAGQPNYDVVAIVQDSLKKVPPGKLIVVHLNPVDLGLAKKLGGVDLESQFSGVKFVMDADIARGHCTVETLVSSIIDFFLREAKGAMTKARSSPKEETYV